MAPSLQALLAGIIDYAGLFPPATLPLDQAIHRYARYRREPESWMLSRFVCPAERLGELAPFVAELFPSGPPLAIAVLGRGGQSAPEFLAGLRADLEATAAFRECHRERVEVIVYETRLPADVLGAGATEATGRLLDGAAETIAGAKLLSLTPFYEAPSGANGRSPVITLSTALAEDKRLGIARGRRRCRAAGLKLRCGGLEAAAFPSPEQVALTITACRDAGVPLKCTAGLHHPMRHFDAGLQTPMHGFLNVFGAGVLAHARQLGEDQVRRIIEDEDPEDFAFDDEGLRWKEFCATVPEIRAARQSAVISFGSCSFDEPRDDLRALGLLQ